MGESGPHLIDDPLCHSEPTIKMHHDRFSRFCTGDRRVFLYFTMGSPFLQNCPFPWGDMDAHLTMIHWAHQSPQPKQHLSRFSHYCWAH